MHLFLEVNVKVLLNRLFHAQFILKKKKNCNINLFVYCFKYFSGKSFTLTGCSSTDYLMNYNSREANIHSGASE